LQDKLDVVDPADSLVDLVLPALHTGQWLTCVPVRAQDFKPRVHISDSDFAIITQGGAPSARPTAGPAELGPRT
jgi:hypothetical protein